MSRYHHVTVLWFSWYSYVGFTSTCRWFMVSFKRNFAKFHNGAPTRAFSSLKIL